MSALAAIGVTVAPPACPFTTVPRLCVCPAAFGLMVVLALRRLVAAGRPLGRPPAVRAAGLPTLFGVCVYSFMCHHSLPSLITPITNKSRITGEDMPDRGGGGPELAGGEASAERLMYGCQR